jgi:hypothetical protein
MADFVNSLQGKSVSDFRIVLLSILTALILSHLVAFAYCLSHTGLSYSRSFVQTLVMGGVIASMLMLAIGSNLVWGIRIVGTLAIVRFRTNLRDPRDMMFIFAALATGYRCRGGCLCGRIAWHRGLLPDRDLPEICFVQGAVAI